MKKVFFLDGGAGRIIAAIPALLRYAKLHPNEDFAILVGAWDFLLWGIPELQDKTYSLDTKGVFDNVVKTADVILAPEPYRNPLYFTQKISLVQGFDLEINGSIDKDLSAPIMVLNQQERLVAKSTLNDLKAIQKKQKTVVFQPFGRGAKVDKETVLDEESRSLGSKDYLSLGRKLANRYNLVFFGEPQFQLPADNFSGKYTCDLRQWGALIEEADYFVGVDSVGQHIARAVGTPGTVIFGSTFPVNTSYPDYFNIFERSLNRKYSPIRIAGLDVSLANRLNEKTMVFDEKALNDLYTTICNDIEKRAKK